MNILIIWLVENENDFKKGRSLSLRFYSNTTLVRTSIVDTTKTSLDKHIEWTSLNG